MCCCHGHSEAARKLGNPSYCGGIRYSCKFSVHGGLARSPCGVQPGSFGHQVESRDFDANGLDELSDGTAAATTIS
jgi:hypothetical protein